MPSSSDEPFPYGTPLWRRSHRAVAPDGRLVAEVTDAREVGMSEPTLGTLRTSDGLVLPDASPAFLFADDGRFLAVPIWHRRWFRVGQRLGVVDFEARVVYRSKRLFPRVEPTAFAGATLTALVWPARSEQVVYRLPEDLDAFDVHAQW